jgi:hypothetical protein
MLWEGQEPTDQRRGGERGERERERDKPSLETKCDRAIGYADKVRSSVSTGWLSLYDQYERANEKCQARRESEREKANG